MRLPSALGLVVAACARAAPPPPPPPPAPAPPAPVESVAVVAVDTPSPLADTMASYRVPPFIEAPLIEWGPLPPGTSRPPRRRTYDLQHQVVRVRLDWARRAVVGSTTIRLAALDSGLTTATFDAVDMRVTAVRTAAGSPLASEYDGRTLAVTLQPRLARGARTTILIEYEAARPRRGVYFADGRRVAWTRAVAEDTRHWVPTYDHPDDRTTWEIHVTTAPGERALSNGRLVGSRPVTGGIEWHWSLDRPAPTFLMSVVTGDYVVLQDVWRDISVGYWTWADSVEAAWRGFGPTPRMMELLARRTGLAYPWEKYDQSVVPDGDDGMEGLTATAHDDDHILHPAWAEPHANAEASVIHALAHQWYGGYVTPGEWKHLWLSEGLAAFFEGVWAAEAHGRDAGAVARLAAQEQSIVADRAARRPLVYGRWVGDPGELLDGGQLRAKGASVLHMLRRTLGEAIFWGALRSFTRAQALGNAETADLQREMERASGRDLRPFFDQWIYGAGFPTFRVTYAYDSASRGLGLSVRQVQPRDSLTGFFDADVDVEVLTDRGAVRGTVRIRGERAAIALSLPAPPRSIRWDKGGWLLGIADFPRPTVMLAHQLAHDDDVLGRIEAAELLRDRSGDGKARDALVTAVARDSAWAVRVRAAGALESFAADSAGLAALLAATNDRDARVRERAAAALGSSRRVIPRGRPADSTARATPDTLIQVMRAPADPRVLERLDELIQADSSRYVRGAAVFAYAMLAPEIALPVVDRVLRREGWGDVERLQAILALALIDTPASWRMTMRYLAPGTSRAVRRAAIESLTARARGREAELAAALVPLLDLEDPQIRIAVARALGSIGEGSVLPALEARRRVETESRVLTAIDGALAALRAR